MDKSLFQKYHKRIVKEGILKAFLISLAIGCGVLTLSMILSWFFGFKAGLWLSLGLFVATVGACTPLFYIWKFRPSAKEIASRIDALGLEERVLTMTELENDDSYIAKMQREDTLKALGTVNHMLIKIVVSAALIAVTSVVGIFGIGSTTVNSLYYANAIPSGMQLLSESVGVKTYLVAYDVELSDSAKATLAATEKGVPESGYGYVYYYDEENWRPKNKFEGQLEFKEGENAPAVIAVATSGYVFLRWSDGVSEPFRQDIVKSDILVFAIFEVMPDLDVEDPVLSDPSSPQPGSGTGDGGSEENDGGEEGDGGEGDGGDSAGGNHNSASNATVDGDTYYGDDFSSSYNDAQDRLNGDGELSDAQKDWANGYFESIESGK